MSKGFSFVVVGGGLGRDPEIRSTQGGKRVASFSVAVEEGYGERQSTAWYDCIAWEPLADFVEKHLKKGKQVIVSGSLQTRSWDDKSTGAKRTKTEIVAKDIKFGDDGKSGGSGQPARAAAAPPARRETPQPERREAADPFGDEEEAF